MAGAVTKAKKKVLPVSGTSERTNTRGRQTDGTSRKGGPVVERQYVGIDLHRRRSVIVRMDEDGEKLETVRVDNDPVALGMALAEAGPDPEVALEATYGWYWAVDLLQASGAKVHLVHPSGLHWGARRVKNDERDATEIAQRLRRNDLPEAWNAPPQLRELRELVRYRASWWRCARGSRPRCTPCWPNRAWCPSSMTCSVPRANASSTTPPWTGASTSGWSRCGT